MSVILIDSFVIEEPTFGAGTYNILLDNSDGSISLSFIGSASVTPVSEAQRGRTEDSLVGDIIKDDGTLYYRVLASYDTPYAYVSEEILIPPTPPTCDLTLTATATSETEQGANDGTITAVAETTYTLAEYSLDNVTFQSIGLFEALAPGNYIVYAMDANDCTKTFNITVTAYNNPITSYPVVTVSSGNVSRWSAAYNPIYFTFQRKDFTIVEISDAGGGKSAVKISGLLTEDQIAEALMKPLYIKGTLYDWYGLPYTITEVAGESVITITHTFLGDESGIVVIDFLKPNYKIELEITYGSNPYIKNTITGSWSPDYTGVTKADVSHFVSSLVNANDDFSYNVINQRDINRSASYTVRYREVWDGDSSDWYYAPTPYYVVYAAMQLQEQYGGNMAKYVPFMLEDNESLKAKFMTAFNEPYRFIGLPWDISFIYSENVVNEQLKLRQIFLDLNRVPISGGGGSSNSYLLANDAGYLLSSDAGIFLIQETATPVADDDIIDELGVNRLVPPGTPPDGACYESLQLYYGDDEDPYFITQSQIVRLVASCENDPYAYLKWINHLGGWDYFRFGFNQTLSMDVDNVTVIDRPVIDWANDSTIADVVNKRAFERMAFGVSGLKVQDVEGLKELAISPKVMILTNVNPIRFQTVIITPGSFNIRQTRKDSSTLTFTAVMPERNIQRQ